MNKRSVNRRLVALSGWILVPLISAAAEATPLFQPAPSPSTGASVLRVFGSMAIVIGLFLGGVWLFRNWQRLSMKHGKAPRLQVLEMRPLGGRQAIYVVGYEQQRLLVASSPAGITLLSHLPPADSEPVPLPVTATPTSPPPETFLGALRQAMTKKAS